MDDTTRAAYETLARLENIEDEWAREAAEREGQRYWETPPEPKPKRTRGLDTSPQHQSKVHNEDLASAPVLTADQIRVLGAALAEIRKQIRDEFQLRVDVQNEAVSLLREELRALRSEVAILGEGAALLRDNRNVVELPRRDYEDAAA